MNANSRNLSSWWFSPDPIQTYDLTTVTTQKGNFVVKYLTSKFDSDVFYRTISYYIVRNPELNR